MATALTNFKEIMYIVGNDNALSDEDFERLGSFLIDCMDHAKRYEDYKQRKKEERRRKNREISEEVLKAMYGSPDGRYTVTEVCRNIPMYSLQRVSRIFNDILVPEKKAIREFYHGRVMVYSRAENVD